MTDRLDLPRESLPPLAALVDDVLVQYGYKLDPAVAAVNEAVPGIGGLFDPATTADELRAACEAVVDSDPPTDTNSTAQAKQRPGAVVLYVDGSSRGNPGAAGAGAVILFDGEERARLGRPVGAHTGNNVAEYAALHMGLAAVVHWYEPETLKIRIDSMTVIDRVWGAKSSGESFRPYSTAVDDLLSAVPNNEWTHLADSDPNPADARATVGADIASLGP